MKMMMVRKPTPEDTLAAKFETRRAHGARKFAVSIAASKVPARWISPFDFHVSDHAVTGSSSMMPRGPPM